MYVLNANHISKSYKTAGETMRILQNVNLQIMKGEMVAIMGPSGSGKTTLLHVLTGVDTPDDGEIVIGGETFSQLTEEEKAFFRRKHMGMIFQDFQLLESLTVKENILLPLILERKDHFTGVSLAFKWILSIIKVHLNFYHFRKKAGEGGIELDS